MEEKMKNLFEYLKEYEEREKEEYEKIIQKKKEERMIKELEKNGYRVEIAS